MLSSERSHREAGFYRNMKQTRTGALIRGWLKPAAGSNGLTFRQFRMPRSDCACRWESKLPEGHLEPFFIPPALLHAPRAASYGICSPDPSPGGVCSAISVPASSLRNCGMVSRTW